MMNNGTNTGFDTIVVLMITITDRQEQVRTVGCWVLVRASQPISSASSALCRLRVNNCCVAQSFRDATVLRIHPREYHVRKYRWAYKAVPVFAA
jgi:hypothetical protein